MSHYVVGYTYLPIGRSKGAGDFRHSQSWAAAAGGGDGEEVEEEEVQAVLLLLIQPKQPSYKHSRHLFAVSF